MKRVAITGATGFLAEKLIEQLISLGIEINAIARNEGKLVALKERYNNINIFPCPIEDECLLKKSLKECDGIFHLASFKDVVLSSNNPLKTVQTNIIGTLNLLKYTLSNNNVKFIISTSTDKVAKVSSVYGASKLIVEELFEEFELLNSTSCKYRIVRYGNVFYSTGSVLTKWKDAILNDRDIRITDREATRFFWTREEAINLLFKCLDDSKNPQPLIPEMKSVSMGVLLDTMLEKYGNQYKGKVVVVGLQKGENIHEFLTDTYSSLNAIKWTKEDLLNIV